MKVFIFFLKIYFFCLCFSFIACRNFSQPDAKSKMKSWQNQDTILLGINDTFFLSNSSKIFKSTFFCVRHAEKSKAGTNDPHLNEVGKERANTLSKVLEKVNISDILSTQYNRTIQTAQPTADSKGVTIQIYNPGDLNLLASTLVEKHQNEKVLIVGHSNTTPDLINAFSNSDNFKAIDEDIYDNFYIVQIQHKGDPIIHLLSFNPY